VKSTALLKGIWVTSAATTVRRTTRNRPTSRSTLQNRRRAGSPLSQSNSARRQKGTGGKPGVRRLLNTWTIFHLGVGVLFGQVVPVTLVTAANTVLLPLVGVLIGLSFAWAGNAQALLQVSEIEDMAEHHPGGFREYVFVYQAAILTILVTVVAWAIAGFEVFDKVWPTPVHVRTYFVVKTILFALSSLTLRECWHVVSSAQWMLLSQKLIKQSRKQQPDIHDDDSS